MLSFGSREFRMKGKIKNDYERKMSAHSDCLYAIFGWQKPY